MATAKTAWKNATDGCLKLLAQLTSLKVGTSLFIGDENQLPEDRVDLALFIISGGPEQIQNFQCPAPGKRWYAQAQLIGQFSTLDNAWDFAGKVINGLPAYVKYRSGGGMGLANRGIAPNVNAFEILTHPELASRPIEKGCYFLVRFVFRVVYDDNVN